MVKHFKRLGKHVLVYGLADMVNKLLAIFLIPIFTRYLTPAEYGISGVLLVTTTLVTSFCDLGLTSGMARFFHAESEENRKKLASTAQIAMVCLSLLMAVIAIIFAPQLSNLLFKSSNYQYIIIINFITIPLTVFISAPLMRLRLAEKAKLYSFINISKVLIGLILNITLIVFLKRGLNGLFEGPFITALIFAVIIGFYSIGKQGLYFSSKFFRSMFAIGFPFIFAGMFFWVINWADRFILARLSNLTEVGLYTLGYSVGMAIMLPVGAFNTAWAPFYLSIAKEKNAKEIYALVMTYYFVIIAFCVLVLSVFSRDYFYFFTPENFHSAYIVIPVISLAYAIFGIFSVTVSAAFLSNKTILSLVAELIAVIVNVGLMFLLIPMFGRMGAAWATLAAYFTLPVMMIFLTRKIYPVKYDYQRLLQILVVTLGLYFVSQTIYQPTVWNIILRLAILLTYPIFFLLLGFFRPDEIKALKSFKAKIFRKNLPDEPTIT